MEKFLERVKENWTKAQPVFRRIGDVLKKIWNVLKKIGKFLWRIHAIFLAIPVVLVALRLAEYSRENLPDNVGIYLLQNGDYAYTVTKNVAIMGPLAVTAACLLMMFCSRRTIYPWIISIFSLVLPILIIVTNVFPA